MTAPGDDRLRLLLGGLDAAWEMLDARLTGRAPFQGDAAVDTDTDLTDDEYFWEPASGCWSIRRRGDAESSMPWGSGEWVMDYERPAPQPPPITTIAWRLCHLAQWQLMRYDWTFGSRSLQVEDISWPGTARDAVAFLRDSHKKWRTALAETTPDDLDTVGRSQMPNGLDPSVRFDDLVAWTNVEFAHHAAEVALLRDLYRARFRA